MSIMIKGGRLINPATDTDQVVDMIIDEETGTISQIETFIEAETDRVIDAVGCYLFPGFIDMHVHMRDPGQTAKGDITTESRAAARGGFTTVLAMPNTKPPVDSPEGIRYVHDKAKKVGLVNVLQVGAVTKGMEGRELSDIPGMKAEGMVAISEDGKSVMDSGLLYDAMRIAEKNDITVLSHCEDATLVRGGVMNEGNKSRAFGVPGILKAVENNITARDIFLAQETGARLHICHVSAAESAEMIRLARDMGVHVTGEVCPHHFILTDEDIPSVKNTEYKMNPPLRSAFDRDAMKEAIRDGVITVISTDHAPHAPEDKAGDFTTAAFGIVGLETSASLTHTELVLQGYLDPMGMARCMSYNPAQILGLDRGDLSVGKVADITIFNPNKSYTIESKSFVGKSKNMPYEGREVTGRVVTTIMSGKVTYELKEKKQEKKGLIKRMLKK
ncbi:MAG: dihydroorotase [Lachnospiraceae bacterium]|nr:dihydroorotase [Lachnospiraceae bacterium]